MITAGWKSISMVDVHGKVTFTLWLCGCNLRCPFCHNWRIAEGLNCFPLDRNALLEELESSAFLVDYFHVTGGEPLMQWRELSSLLERVRSLEIPVSLNSNLTLVKPLEKLLKAGLIEHIATDLKVPPTELYGMPEKASLMLWKLFLRSLEVVSTYKIPLELRIPVTAELDIIPWVKEALEKINTELYIILNPLVGRPLANPRNEKWCSEHCRYSKETIRKLRESLEQFPVDVYLHDLSLGF